MVGGTWKLTLESVNQSHNRRLAITNSNQNFLVKTSCDTGRVLQRECVLH